MLILKGQWSTGVGIADENPHTVRCKVAAVGYEHEYKE